MRGKRSAGESVARKSDHEFWKLHSSAIKDSGNRIVHNEVDNRSLDHGEQLLHGASADSKEQDMPTPEELAQLRSLIDERHMALETELHSDAARARAETYGELAGPVADPGDSASATLISDISNAELRRDLQELRALEAARDRINDGTYGFCMDCGQDIGFKRLLAQPAALRCLPHQQAYEKTHAQGPKPTL